MLRGLHEPAAKLIRWAFALSLFVMGAQRWWCLQSTLLTSRGFLDRNLKLNSTRGEKAKPFHQEWAFENLACQMFSLLVPKAKWSRGGITMEDGVGDGEEGFTGVPCCGFRVKTQSKDPTKSSHMPRRRQSPERSGCGALKPGGRRLLGVR